MPQVVSGTRSQSAEIPPAPVVAGASGTAGKVESAVPSDTKAQERIGGGPVDEVTTTKQGGTPTSVEISANIGAPADPPQGEVAPPALAAQSNPAPVAAATSDAGNAPSEDVPPPSQAEGARDDEDAGSTTPSQASSADENVGLAETPGASGTEGAPNTADTNDGEEG